MYKILLYLIVALHSLLVLFLIVAPFTNITPLIFLHAVMIPFIILHWVLNNNTCALTLAEFKIREYINGGPVDRSQCFMARLMDPVYDFKKNNHSRRHFLYFSMLFLWAVSCYKLYKLRSIGKLNTFDDFFLFKPSQVFESFRSLEL